MRLVISEFGGIAPRFPDLQLKIPFARTALNCDYDRAQLRALDAPLKSFPSIATSTLAVTPRSLFYYKPENVEYILSFSELAYCVQNPLPNDSYKRVYWLRPSDGILKYGDATVVTAGNGPYPASAAGYILGVPEPTGKPVLTRVPYDASVTDPETKDGKIPYYRAITYAWITKYGERGGMYAPADGSALGTIKVYEGDKIEVSGLDTGVSGNYPMGAGAFKELYCTDTSGNWRIVGKYPVGTSTIRFDPFALDSAPVATNANNEQPPTGLKGIAMSHYGFMYGWKGKTLCVSDYLQMNSWNSDYQKQLPHNIMGVVPTNSGAIVITDGGVFVAMGTAPANIDCPIVQDSLGCVSIESIVDMGGYAMFATADGIAVCDGSTFQVVTEDVILRTQFDNYNPQNFRCFRHTDKFIIAAGDLSCILNPNATNSKLMPIGFDFTFIGGFTHKLDNKFYFVDASNNLLLFDGDDSKTGIGLWKSPTIRAPHRIQPRWVGLDGENLTKCKVVVRANGVDITNGGLTPTTSNRAAFCLPPFAPHTDFRVEIELTGASINNLTLANSKKELADGKK